MMFGAPPPSSAPGGAGGGFTFGAPLPPPAPAATAPTFGVAGNASGGSSSSAVEPTKNSAASGSSSMAFDPKSPAALYLPLYLASAPDAGGGTDVPDPPAAAPLNLRTFLADDGVGCNDFEASALMRLLDSRDEYREAVAEARRNYHRSHSMDVDVEGGGSSGAPSLRELSRAYRRALRDCMSGWEDKLAADAEGGANDAAGDDTAERDSLELLKMCYAVVQLGEVYLLPASSASVALEGLTPEDVADFDALRPPGSVTADTVRYLRHNHMGDPYALGEEGNVDVDEMLASAQPEYYGGGVGGDDTGGGGGGGGGDGAPFWALVRRLALRGCLRDAWNALTRHSACRRCLEKHGGSDSNEQSGFRDGTVEEDYVAFGCLQDVFLWAPLPGGLSDADDACLGDDEGDEDNPDRPPEGDVDQSYKLWDGASARSSSASSDDPTNLDLPNRYDRNAALSAHRRWREHLSGLVDGPRSPLGPTLRRLPPLRRVLEAMLGRFDNVAAGVNLNVGGGGFESWPEALCAELVFTKPDLRAEDVAVRARAAIRRCGSGVSSNITTDDDDNIGLDGIVLGVMLGDAGKVVNALHGSGGGSGAALPATITSLLCDLLTDAGRIAPYDPTTVASDSPDLRTEFLLSASSSILASFASNSSGHPGVGVRLSTRLLLPRATPSGGDERVVATLAELLSRHRPKSDAEAKDLLALTAELCARGSREIVDASESLALCRASEHEREGRPGGMTHWLLRGVECRASSPNNSSKETILMLSVCGRKFVGLCGTATSALVRSLALFYRRDTAGGSEGAEMLEVNRLLVLSCEIVRAVTDDETMARFAGAMGEVKLLRLAVGIAEDRAKGQRQDAAANITRCLEERVIDDEGGDDDEHEAAGDVTTLAPPGMHGDLLSLAHGLLLEGGGSEDEGNCSEQSVFDVAGVRTLMAAFARLEMMATRYLPAPRTGKEGFTEEAATSSVIEGLDDDVLREALCKGLVGAFVAENARLDEGAAANRGEAEGAAAGAAFDDVGGTVALERSLDLMLGPSM